MNIPYKCCISSYIHDILIFAKQLHCEFINRQKFHLKHTEIYEKYLDFIKMRNISWDDFREIKITQI